MTDIAWRIEDIRRWAIGNHYPVEARIHQRAARAITSLQVHRGAVAYVDGLTNARLRDLSCSLEAYAAAPDQMMATLNRLASGEGAVAAEYADMDIPEAVEAAAADARPLPTFEEASAVRKKPASTEEEAEAQGGVLPLQREEAQRLAPPARVLEIVRVCNYGEFDQLLRREGVTTRVEVEGAKVWYEEDDEECHALFSEGFLDCSFGYRLADGLWSWSVYGDASVVSHGRQEGAEATREAARAQMPARIKDPDYAETEYFGGSQHLLSLSRSSSRLKLPVREAAYDGAAEALRR